jgi:anti-anti-sigma factor
MTSDLVDTLRLTHDRTGTTAIVIHELSRPARLLTAAELASGLTPNRPGPAEPFLILDQPSAPGPRLRVDGPIDANTAPQLDSAVRQAAGAGTSDLIVDLTGVSHLASAGVAVLHRLAALSATNGGRLSLYAPPGTPADMIMTLVNLRHLTTDPDEADA